ncbi:MAG: hypothetical protein LBP69_10765 [Treponema sp.]|jgi:hypothetical protein|nr:hypothetical protein [Treponema sp.]
MKKIVFLTVLVMAVVVMATSCVTTSAIGGTLDSHGLFSGGGAKAAVTDGAEEIASYSNILGLFDTGYADYAAAVKEAEAAGKQITTTVTSYFVLYTTTAFAK